MIESCLFNKLTSFAWVACGLGTNCFSCPGSARSSPSFSRLVRFATGQPLGFLSSWPLFALCHHFILWYCAEHYHIIFWCADQVYPGRKFDRYAILGDDVVICDRKVAGVYEYALSQFGVAISYQKSLISSTGCAEFAKRFMTRGLTKDLSPVSIRSLLNFFHPYGLMAINHKYGCAQFS